MTIHDTETRLPLGNPDMDPFSVLEERGEAFPTSDDVQAKVASMILSASGWRSVFAVSGDEEDSSPEIGAVNTVISALVASVFADYIISLRGKNCTVAVGIDSRPTGTEIADVMIRVLTGKGVDVQYLFITAAPEIMAYSKTLDGFVYISASHNPVGHNGVKFGLNDGGVLPGAETSRLTAAFRTLCAEQDAVERAISLARACSKNKLEQIYSGVGASKAAARAAYSSFTKTVVSGTEDAVEQQAFFDTVKKSAAKNPLSIVCDMNGSARTLSIDRGFLEDLGIGFDAINDVPRQIVHAIIPEPENLVLCAEEMARLKQSNPAVTLGYMPDCDGDRGNIVFWNDKTGKPEVLRAQEVFALSVLAELAYRDWTMDGKPGRTAVAVNDPTSMRIDEIAKAFSAEVVRAEVGEANVVNLARETRTKGYTVPILGEGSNGGNITHPAAVRDPLNTIFALVKLLVLRDTVDGDQERKGLFHRWCDKSGQQDAYRRDFTLSDIIATLPVYTTTGVSESRALLQIKTSDHSLLKSRFQKEFERSWEEQRSEFLSRWNISGYVAICNNGTKEQRGITDYSVSNRGGLKILFQDGDGHDIAFIWMRGSGTEPVFRIMCDVKGDRPEMEAELLAWESELLRRADG